MPIPDVADIKNRFGIDLPDHRIQAEINSAASQIRRAVGIDVYNEVFEGATSTLEDSDIDLDTTNVNETAFRIADLTEALILKAFVGCIRNANARIRRSGSVKKEQDAASPAAGGGRLIINEYMTPEEVNAMVAGYEAQADVLIGLYFFVSEVNAFVEYSLSR